MPTLADSLQSLTLAPQAWLEALNFARANGSALLDSASTVLHSSLSAVGLGPQTFSFACHPDRSLVTAAFLLLSALLLARARGRHRAWLGAVLASWLLGAGCMMGLLDPILPRHSQEMIWVRLDGPDAPQNEVLLLAHLDSKTEPLDHVGRTILLLAAGLASGTACFFVSRGSRRSGWAVSWALLMLLALASQLALGRWIFEPSAGIVDDAGACVLLADLATDLKREPLQRTRLCFLWTSGEEVGAQGAAAIAGIQMIPPGARFINLEGIGAGPELALASWELGGGRLWPLDADTESILRQCTGSALRALPYPLWSDAGALRRSGLHGVTLLNLERGAATIRGLHGPSDRMQRFDWRGYTRTREVLRCALESMDREAASSSP